METTSFDILTKTLLVESRFGLVTWLSGRTPSGVELVPTELLRTDISLADQILRAEVAQADADRPSETEPEVRYFHVELQTAGDPDMPLRMAQYWTSALRRFSKEERQPVTVSSAVIYLDRRQYRKDPGAFSADDGEGTTGRFTYRVVRLWEIDAGEVLRFPRPGLAPFAPLMRTEDPIGTVVQSKQKILESEPGQPAGAGALSERRKAELCGALFALAGLVIDDRDLLFKLLWEDWMGLERSVTVQWLMERGMEKGVTKGLARGSVEARREDVLAVLESRFGAVGEDLRRRIEEIQDPALLRDLLRRAVAVATLGDFGASV